ncbi:MULTISPECIES: anthranilate 1,2-dioxygenase small subunit [Pseudomonas]|uniref:Anthranilate 1,2-dioxygenase small subunit n=12 Tax=Pseudomonas syringae group TaxID=136849 RepID=A0A2K4WSR3_PSESX|nr:MULTISPECIES: anthranilate 1,2-dioxygenase small subunit [Pseudomonas]KPX09865.1 Benzoate 1,2-dioxygenase beta subunit [Pseudomonas syringae pv. cunninghamiae]ARD11789.1 anthranilate 1,2-dioxygenase small subunit [Pseudomonas savastanoi pv. savastanoi NCPPB 3335]AVB15557.1 anthranilate 1,2-dioxygenase small subunit [Pseudomonas amygdali pv. morsprunorum]EGH03767.1 small subunit of terminal oxygenase component of anthranilate 1,2-dioxygenase [Pseudomonas amygdali pv. aesculi str. 0893_23]KAA
MSAQLQYRIEQFLYHMAEVCDAQDWDRYLDLFSEDSEFHLPQWDSEHVYTTDPRKGMSLIYYPNRGGLEDRVYRLRTGKAASTIPMPRTLHLISNVRIAPAGEGANGQAGELDVQVNWHTLYYRLQVAEQFFGRASYRLRPDGDSWKIARKHVVLLNDTINSVLDFYHL